MLDANTAFGFSLRLCSRGGLDDWLHDLCLFGLCLLLLWLLLLGSGLFHGSRLLLLQLLLLLSLLLLLGSSQLLWLLLLLYRFDNWLSSDWLGGLFLGSGGWFGLLLGGLALGLDWFLRSFDLLDGPFILVCLHFLHSLLGCLLAAASPCLGIFELGLVEPRVRVLCILVSEVED